MELGQNGTIRQPHRRPVEPGDRRLSPDTFATDLAVDSAGPARAVSEGMYAQIDERRDATVDCPEEPGGTTSRAWESHHAVNGSRRVPTPTVLGTRIRAERRRLGLSQQEFATALRAAGWVVGAPNSCTKRLVQKWERGEHRNLTPAYQLALANLTGADYGSLAIPLAPPEPAKVARALEGCIIRLSGFEHDLAQFHRQLAELYEYMAGGSRSVPAPADVRAD